MAQMMQNNERESKGVWSMIVECKRFLADDCGQDLIE
jgi:hypothetical protein